MILWVISWLSWECSFLYPMERERAVGTYSFMWIPYHGRSSSLSSQLSIHPSSELFNPKINHHGWIYSWEGNLYLYTLSKYRVIQILRAASDSCCLRSWLACWPESGPLYSRCFQTLTLLFQFIFPVDGHAETLAFADCDYCYVSTVRVIIVICDMPRQEFSLCEHVYIHNTYMKFQ